jgi:hypothetical protein
VWENENSPAVFLNRDRYASQTPPASATPDAAPAWKRLHGGDTVRWHDHRVHWMSTIPPPEVQADPGRARVIFDANHVDLVVDGSSVSAMLKLSWVPRPHPWIWLALVAAGACAALVLIAMRPWVGPWLALIAAAAALVGRGPGTGWLIAGLSAVALAIGGVVLAAASRDPIARRPGLVGERWLPFARRWLPVAAGAIAVAIGFWRLDVFHHALTSGRWPGTPQRCFVAVALAGGMAVVAAVFVSPTVRPTAPRSAPRSAPALHPSG